MSIATVADVELQLTGEMVEFIGIGADITLRFSNDCVVRLGSDFSMTNAHGQTTVIDPEGDKALFVSVETARIDGSFHIIEFICGAVLEAGPDEDYESWSYTGPEQPPTRVIVMPGGELAIWLPDDRPR